MDEETESFPGLIIYTDEQFEEALNDLTHATYITMDIETKPFDTADDGQYPEMVGISTYIKVRDKGGFREAGYWFPFRHDINPVFGDNRPRDNLPTECISPLREILTDRNKILIGHNLPFDFTCLQKEGWKIPSEGQLWFDTLFLTHMVNENFQSFQLEWLASVLFNDTGAARASSRLHKFAETFGGLQHLPPEVVGQYSIGDVRRTYKLYRWVRPKLEEEDLLDLWWPDEADFCLELANITRRGVLVDVETAKELADESEQQIRLIQNILGFDPGKPSQLAPKLFSDRGLGLPLPHLSTRNQKPPFITPDGRKITKVPIMDRPYLEQYREHDLIESVLRYRTYQKAYSTWFQGWLDKLARDGRIHPSFKRHGTVTSRLSSAEPNFHQLPRRSDDPAEEAKYIKHRVKSMVAAPPGYAVYEFDYSQIEYRLAACYGQDPHVISALNNGEDFHSITAKQIEVNRYAAKTVNFAILYGAGAAKMGGMLGVSLEEAQELIQDIRAGYPGLYQAILRSSWNASQNGYVDLWTGRRRHFRSSEESYKAFNSMCQGGAAEIVRYTMLKLAKEVPQCPMIAQVHDSIWVEVPLDDLEENLALVKRTMEEWVSSHFPVIYPVEEKQLAISS